MAAMFWKKWEHIPQELVSAHMDGRSHGRECQRVEEHLELCAACREEMEGLRSTVALLRRLPVAPVPRPFALDVAAARQAPGVPYPLALRVAATVAVLLLAMLVAADFWGFLPQRGGGLVPTARPGMDASQSSLGAELGPVSPPVAAPSGNPQAPSPDRSTVAPPLTSEKTPDARQPEAASGAPTASRQVPALDWWPVEAALAAAAAGLAFAWVLLARRVSYRR